jgi:hypothetical protein
MTNTPTARLIRSCPLLTQWLRLLCHLQTARFGPRSFVFFQSHAAWRAFDVRFGAIGSFRCLFSSLLSTRALCLSRCGGKSRFLFSILFLSSHFLFRLLFSAGRCVSGSNQRLRSHLSSCSSSFRGLISLDFPSRVIANLNVSCAFFCLSLLPHFFHACWLVFRA